MLDLRQVKEQDRVSREGKHLSYHDIMPVKWNLKCKGAFCLEVRQMGSLQRESEFREHLIHPFCFTFNLSIQPRALRDKLSLVSFGLDY